MWLFTVYGFFSVASAQIDDVTNPEKFYYIDSDNMMIRTRVRQHLVNLQNRFATLEPLEIKVSNTNDYMFRMIVPKAVWADCVKAMAEEQEWSNFKNECHEKEERLGRPYVNALHAIWSVMYKLQPLVSRIAAPSFRAINK